ncbi:AMP-binding enzyme family protein [Mycobacterium xenopi 3993]|nr:AMP-binding enzyme family protein [Mycobacterium xenopi 3993]
MLRTDPVGPRITYYDDAIGERIELSAATLANWAAKTGNLLRDELGTGPGGRVAVLLPAHWQTAAVCFGVWWIGAEVVFGHPADVALCTSARLHEADATGASEVAVLSLDPFGRPARIYRSASPTTPPRCGCTPTRSPQSAVLGSR